MSTKKTKTKPKTKTESDGFEVTLETQEIRGKLYGIAPVTVKLGYAPLAGVAVRAGDERKVTTREHVVEWLAVRGLDRPGEAEKFVREGLRASPKPPRRAYVAIIDPNGRHKLGIAEDGEPGYFPISDDSDLGGSYQNREHALETAEECNKRLGLTAKEAAKIVASSIGASMRARPR